MLHGSDGNLNELGMQMYVKEPRRDEAFTSFLRDYALFHFLLL